MDKQSNTTDKMTLSDEEWQERLDPQAYKICRQKGTEGAFTGKYNSHYEKGNYVCHCCGEKLFSSTAKFDSGSGWPSFDKPMDKIDEHADQSFGMRRVEITCPKCESHLGHVFNDGPTDTGLRYCVNSASLDFVEE